jgi:hypothetical protein
MSGFGGRCHWGAELERLELVRSRELTDRLRPTA